jgi:hypothetical protein
METASANCTWPPIRLVGTAASALEPIVASLLNIELGQTGARAGVSGRPQGWVIGWSAATIGGSLISDVVAPHRLAAISQSLSRLWPPGPQAIAAPTALIIEALIAGSRLPHSAMTVLDGEFDRSEARRPLPLELGRGRNSAAFDTVAEPARAQ